MTNISADEFRRRISAALPDPSAVHLHPTPVPISSQPSVVDLSPLRFVLDDGQFVDAAYRLVLGREPDLPGLLHHREALRTGVPRDWILERLIGSDEARQLGRRFRGAPGLSTVRQRLTFWARGGWRTLRGRFTARLRVLAKGVLQISRMERIERTVDALLHEVILRSEQISSKSDQSLYLLSGKLDAYIANVETRQEKTTALIRSTTANLDTQLNLLSRTLSAVAESLSREISLDRTAADQALLATTDRMVAAQETTLARMVELRRVVSDRAASLQASLAGSHENLTRTVEHLMVALAEKLDRTAADQAMAATTHHIIAAQEATHMQTARLERDISDLAAKVRSEARGLRHEILTSLSEIARQGKPAEANFAALGRSLESLLLKTEVLSSQMSTGFRLENFEAAVRSAQKSPAVFGGENVTASEVDGFILGVPAEEWRMAAYHVFRGVMEPGVVSLFKRLVEPGMVVVDVGANVGLYTLEAARLTGLTGKVYSFEPTPRTFALLLDNIQVNGFLESGIVDARQEAVLDREGISTLYAYRRNCGHNTLFRGESADEELRVPTVSLDVALASVPRVDVIKIDAEGSEPLILRGMQRVIARCPDIRIVLEFAPAHLWRAGVAPEAFLADLAPMNLCYFRIDDVSGEPQRTSAAELLGMPSSNLLLRRLASEVPTP